MRNLPSIQHRLSAEVAMPGAAVETVMQGEAVVVATPAVVAAGIISSNIRIA